MRLVLIILFLCFYSLSPASAQTRSWGGTVHDARTGEALPAVSVCLLRADSSIVQFAQTDAEGRWRLQAADGAGAFLSFSSIGFAKQVIPLAECTESMDVRLRETTIQIREVTVRGNRIWQRGDTLTYRVAGFSQAQDRTIEDVPKKIPGIEVGGSGQIKFQGKPINKLYVEGMDLLGGKYALATRNMPHKMVKNVQVLQSHQPVAAWKEFQRPSSLEPSAGRQCAPPPHWHRGPGRRSRLGRGSRVGKPPDGDDVRSADAEPDDV